VRQVYIVITIINPSGTSAGCLVLEFCNPTVVRRRNMRGMKKSDTYIYEDTKPKEIRVQVQ